MKTPENGNRIHGELLAALGAWAQAGLVGLGENAPDEVAKINLALDHGSRLVVCAVVAGGEPQLDLCLVDTEKKMHTILTVRPATPDSERLN